MSGQNPSGFGQSTTSQPTGFGQSTTSQPTGFGQSTTSQPTGFGQSTTSQPSGFGQFTTSQPTGFGQSTTSQPTGFGQSTTSQPTGFGQSTTSQPTGFGQSTTSQPSVFGQSTTSQPSVFGQSTTSQPSGFGQSTTSQPTGFGQSTTSQPSVFGQSTTSQPSVLGHSATSNLSSFGQAVTSQPLVFGQSASNQPSGFGQSASNQPSGFGQSASNQPSVFGQSASKQQSGFGQSVTNQPSVFGQSSASRQHQFTINQQSMFRQSTSSSQPSLFGKHNAQTTQTATGQKIGGFVQATSAFNQPETPAFGQASSPAFGQNTTSSIAGNSFSTSPTSSGFGKPPPVYGQELLSTQTLFGKPVSSQSASEATVSAIGLHLDSSSSITTSTASSGNAFGGVSSASSLFGKPTVSSKGNVLFEKRETEVIPKGITFSSSAVNIKQEKAGFFYKGQPSAFVKHEKQAVKDEKPTGLFGKTEKPTLFGKPREDTKGPVGKSQEDSKVLFGKKAEAALAGPSTETVYAGGNVTSVKQLFGKPVEDKVNTKDDESEKEKKGFKTDGRLFGKRMPIKRLGRISETEPGSGRRTSQDSDKGPRTPLQRQISEDSNRKVSIVCKQVPTKFNNQQELKRHFRRFGLVTKVFPNVNKMQATIHFKTHDEAAEAKHRGRVIARGIPPMSIFWSTYMLPSSPTETSARKLGDRPFTQSGASMGHVDKPKRAPWKHPDDVSDELSSMAGTNDFSNDKESSTAGSLQERSKRGPSPAPSSSLDIKSEKVSLSQLIGMVARTTTDRVQILKMKDKCIRQNTKKAVNVDATAFVGTCPDMCPEKERYDREDKRQLSYYEIVPGTECIPGKNPIIDHSKAVKEYLRSSPDQDEPLPYELRPLPVLQQTMTYLLKEVANQGEDGRWGDWFDFLWNRTRGIRKDIIQQQLCDRSAADLIEKCARFHIFCSERLCEEDMHCFDAKINNENLTKCLQTLKEFYTDLEKKQKVYCACEAEMRAYTILMNLNEGDTLREVQKLRHEIRQSSHVRFALDVYFALSSNNYIKFFRLLKNGSFANACIMHRYFTQVRIQALLSMMRGYRPGSRPAQIPLSELVRLLAFESNSEAGEFCSHYGFETVEEDVILDRNKYATPDAAWAPFRAKNYIESKLMVSCGEMINGDTFPPNYKVLAPHSSFDHNDRFIFEGRVFDQKAEKVAQNEVKQVTQEVKQQLVTKEEPQQESSSEPVKQQVAPFIVPADFVKNTAKVLFWEVIGEMVMQLGQESIEEVNQSLVRSEEFTDLIMRAHVEDEVLNMVNEIIVDLNAERIRKEAEELRLRKERVSEELLYGLLYDVLNHETDTIAKMEFREVRSQLNRDRIERVTTEIHNNYCEDMCKSIAKDVAAEVFKTDVTERLQEMDRAEEAVKLLRTKRFLGIWKKYYRYVIKLKRAFTEFPASASMDSLEVQNAKLTGHTQNKIVDKQFLVGKTAKLTIQSPLEIMKQREASEYKCAMLGLKRTMQSVSAWQAEDVTQIVQKILLKKIENRESDDKSFNLHMHWKMLICLPEVSTEKSKNVDVTATKLLSDWFTRKFSIGSPPSNLHYEKSQVLTLNRSTHSYEGKNNTRGLCHLGVCVRTVEGCLLPNEIDNMKEDRTFLGTSGMMFVLPAPVVNMNEPNSSFWSSNRKRLRTILEAGSAVQAISLVIFMALEPADYGNHDSFSSVSDNLHLEELIDDDLIFDYHFVEIQFDPTLYHGVQVTDTGFYEKVCSSIEWIADRSLPPPSLKVATLQDFLDKILIKLFYPPMLQNLKKRKENGYLERDPNSILELYNCVIDHARYTLTSSSLSNISWPVPELVSNSTSSVPAKHWNTPEYLSHIAAVLDFFRLPEFIISNPETDSWIDAKRDIRSYLSDHIKVKSPVLWANLNSLLKQVERDFEKKCLDYKGEAGCQPFYVHLPFSRIIPLCIEHKMENIDFRDAHMDMVTMGCVTELRVAYSQKELEDFVLPVDWRHQESEEKFNSSPSLEQTLQVAAYKQASERSKRKTKRNLVVESPEELNESKKLANNLLSAVRHTKAEMENSIKHFEEELAKGESDLNPFGNMSKIEWNQGQGHSSLRRNSDGGLRRKSEEHNFGVKGKRPRKRYSEIGLSERTFPLLSLEENMLNLQKDVKQFGADCVTDYERTKLDIEYNEVLLRRFSKDKLRNETF